MQGDVDLQPDLTLYFDVPTVVGKARTRAAREPDRFEQESASFFDRVRAAYLRRGRENPARMQILDGTAAMDAVKAAVENKIVSRFFT